MEPSRWDLAEPPSSSALPSARKPSANPMGLHRPAKGSGVAMAQMRSSMGAPPCPARSHRFLGLYCGHRVLF